jgi:hypothetical protein
VGESGGKVGERMEERTGREEKEEREEKGEREGREGVEWRNGREWRKDMEGKEREGREMCGREEGKEDCHFTWFTSRIRIASRSSILQQTEITMLKAKHAQATKRKENLTHSL